MGKKRAQAPCDICFRACPVDRSKGERGYCGIGTAPTIGFEGVLMGEEPEISPTYGIYLGGCNLACKFCHYAIMTRRPEMLPPLDIKALSRNIRSALNTHGIRSVSLIGGEPSLHTDTVTRVRLICPDLKLVLNTNGLFSERVRFFFQMIIDVMIVDLHFGNDACAKELADADDYMKHITWNLGQFSNSNIGCQELFIRFLLLPGHLECCFRPAARLAAQRWSEARISLLANYIPPFNPAPGTPKKTADHGLLLDALHIAKEEGLAVHNILGLAT